MPVWRSTRDGTDQPVERRERRLLDDDPEELAAAGALHESHRPGQLAAVLHRHALDSARGPQHVGIQHPRHTGYESGELNVIHNSPAWVS